MTCNSHIGTCKKLISEIT